MPTKKGAGGRLQNYDSHGRYAKTDYFSFETPKESRKEKTKRREAHRRENLFNRARNSKDPYLFEIFLAIENEMPGEVTAVNEKRFDENIGHDREFDIITKKCIIEVKGKARGALTQFKAQQKYADDHGKKHIVYSPDILPGREKEYVKNGIVIVKTARTLLNILKEKQK